MTTPTPTLADTNALFHAYLSMSAALKAAVTTAGKVQLYGPPGLPPAWTLAKAIVFQRQSTRPNDDLPMEYTSYAVRCYGPKAWDANAVWLALKPLVHVRPVTPIPVGGGKRGLLQYARIVSSAADAQEPEPLNWPYVLAIVEVHWIDRLQ